MSRQRKNAAVLQLLRGEDLEIVSRAFGVTAETLRRFVTTTASSSRGCSRHRRVIDHEMECSEAITLSSPSFPRVIREIEALDDRDTTMPGVNDIEKTLNAIYGAAASPERWPDALGLVADFLGASAGLVAFHPARGQRGFLFGGRIREDLTDLYLTRHSSNVIAHALSKRRPGEPVLTNTIIDMQAIRRSDFYADILAPQKIAGMLAVKHPSFSLDGGVGGFSFNLTNRQLDDHAQAYNRLLLVTPHVSRAIDLSIEIGRTLAARRDLHAVLQAMPGAALLLDALGRVTYANPEAESLLREQDGLSVRATDNMRLVVSDSGEDRALSRAIAASLQIASGRNVKWTGNVKISRPLSLGTIFIILTPLPDVFYPFGLLVSSRPRILVQVLGSNRALERQIAALRARFNLTRAEARVAALISRGLSVPAVAAQSNLAPTTVKTHLGHCFDKIGVRSQVELATLVATMPLFSNE